MYENLSVVKNIEYIWIYLIWWGKRFMVNIIKIILIYKLI